LESSLFSYDPWAPSELNDLPDDVVIEKWSIIARGGHGEIRRAQVRRGEKVIIVALKLFLEEAYDAYMREVDAYSMLQHRGVKGCIAYVQYKAEMPRWKWDGEQPGDYKALDRNEMIYGLMMEYFPNCREMDLGTASLELVQKVGLALDRIHEGGVVHRDIEERNILLVPEGGKTRIVWIDFSCAWTGKAYRPTCIRESYAFRGFLLENMVSF
jgi:serine/threonine protein kinase